VALRVSTNRQLSLGAWAGLGIGTVGLAAEWGWSQLWMPLPWHASLLPGGAVLGLLAGVAGGVIGAFIGRALAPPELERQPTPTGVAVLAWVGATACLALPLPTGAQPAKAELTVTDAPAASGPPAVTVLNRQVDVTARLAPPGRARHANWFNVTAWQGERQGNGGLVISPLRQVGPGLYRTTSPVPVGGTWKTMMRLQRGRDLETVPVWMPADSAIPVAEIPVVPTVTRPFARDKAILQREAIGGSPGLQRAAYAALGLVALAWLGSLGWGLRRLDRDAESPPRSRPPRRPASVPAGRPATA
jgi:hypothetical protein